MNELKDIAGVLDLPLSLAFALYAVKEMASAVRSCREGQERMFAVIIGLLRESLALDKKGTP